MNSVLNHWHLHNSLYFLDPLFDHNLWNNSLDNLRHLDYLLYNSWNNNHLFHNLLNLNYFRYFHHLLDDLLNWHFHLLDPVYMSQDFNDLLFNVFDRLGYFNVVVHNLFNFDHLGLSNYDWISDLHNNWHLPFDDLDNWLFDNLLHFNYPLMNDWNLNNTFHFFGNFSHNLNYPVDDLLNLLDNISLDDLLHNNLHFIGLLNHVGYLDNLLNNLGNFNDPLLSLDDNHRLLDYPVDYHVSNLNVVVNLFSSDDLSFPDYLLHNLLNLHNLWNSDDLLNELLDIDWNLYKFFNNLLNRHELLFDDLHFSNLCVDVVDYFSHWHRLLHFYDLFNKFLNDLYLWYFFNDLDNSLNHCWHLHSLLHNPFHLDDSFLDSIDNNRNFNWDWHFFLDFLDLFNLNYLLDYLLD